MSGDASLIIYGKYKYMPYVCIGIYHLGVCVCVCISFYI